jgi:hypothetical protein
MIVKFKACEINWWYIQADADTHIKKKNIYIIYQSNTKVTCIIFVLEDGLANDYVMREWVLEK